MDEDTINAVKNCILATKIPQNPRNLLERIICDADVYHFGTNDFPVTDRLVRKETEAIHHIEINKDEWLKGTIRLFQNHCYHTDYCKAFLNEKKQENLEKLQKTKNWHTATINPMNAYANALQVS